MRKKSAKNGAAAYRLCATCHSLQPGINLSGPSLADVWGKKAASTDGYGRYTKALKMSGIVWDENTLNSRLAEPQALVPGTTMTFRGIPQNDTRASLIDFLRVALAQGRHGARSGTRLISPRLADGQVQKTSLRLDQTSGSGNPALP